MQRAGRMSGHMRRCGKRRCRKRRCRYQQPQRQIGDADMDDLVPHVRAVAFIGIRKISRPIKCTISPSAGHREVPSLDYTSSLWWAALMWRKDHALPSVNRASERAEKKSGATSKRHKTPTFEGVPPLWKVTPGCDAAPAQVPFYLYETCGILALCNAPPCAPVSPIGRRRIIERRM